MRTSAINRGATVLIAPAARTAHSTGMRLTKMPVKMLVTVPAMRDGRTWREVLMAVEPWTSWKLRRGLVVVGMGAYVWGDSQETAV